MPNTYARPKGQFNPNGQSKTLDHNLEKQLKRTLLQGDKNYAKQNGKGSNHLRKPKGVAHE